MSTSATHYTKLYPKQGNLTGSPDQAYNFLPAKYFDHILGGIGAGTIAALGTIALGSYNLSYIYAPQVHTNLSGNFMGFVGNASNKIGEFSCIHIHKDSFVFFQIIDSKANLDKAMPSNSSNLTPFASDLLTYTDWSNPSDDIIGALFPNFFIVYFGQDFPQGGISFNDIKVKLAKLGTGYDLWVSAAAEAIGKKDDIREVLGAASEQTNYSRMDFLKSYFFSSYNSTKSLPMPSKPHGFITFVDSDLYPVEADELRKIFIPALTSPLLAMALSTLNTLTLQLPSNAEKEAKVKKGITKLLLFHICGKLSDDPTSFGNLSYPKPVQGMRVVLDSAQSACTTGFSNLFQEHLCYSKRAGLDKYQNTLDLNCVHQQSYSPSPIATKSSNRRGHLVQQQSRLHQSALPIPPPRNTSMINREHSNNLTARSENNMEIADAHKSKTNVVIIRIGTMVDMTNFSSLCINCNTIISAIIGGTRPQPLYCQILLKSVHLLNNPDFDAWYAATKESMPSLHWHVYFFLERIFNLFTKFATDFGNVNVMTGLHPLAELNTKRLVKALTVLKAFKDQLTLAQSTNSPIPILAATVSKFSTRSPGNNSKVGTPAQVPVFASAHPENTLNQHRDAKHDPSTPDKSMKAAATQSQKKPRQNGATNPAKECPVMDMGMFFLTKHDIKAIDIFPKDLPNKICADFTCKGRKCTRENRPHSHPRNACKLTRETVAAIVRHFSSKKIGWLNKWHFMKLGNLPADAKVLVGGKDGPSSSKRA
jgi:hypothetical protein